jgi:hypothetical protein
MKKPEFITPSLEDTRRKLSKIENITDIFTKKGIKKLKVGQILIFNKDNDRIELKITKITDDKVMAKRVVTYREDELVVTGKKTIFGKAKRQTLKEYAEGNIPEKEVDKRVQ